MGRRKLDRSDSLPSDSSDSEFETTTLANSGAISSGTLSYPEKDYEFTNRPPRQFSYNEEDSDSGLGTKKKRKNKKTKKKRKKSSKKKTRKRRKTNRKNSPHRDISNERYLKNPSLERRQASPPKRTKSSKPKKDSKRGRSKTVPGDLAPGTFQPGTYTPASPPSTSNKKTSSHNISELRKRSGGVIDPRVEKARIYSKEMNTANSVFEEGSSVLLKNFRKPRSQMMRRQGSHSSDTVVPASRPPQGYQPRHRLHPQQHMQYQQPGRKRPASTALRQKPTKPYKKRMTQVEQKQLHKAQAEQGRWIKRRREQLRRKSKLMKEQNIPMPSPAYQPLYDILSCLRKRCLNQLTTALKKLYADCEYKAESGKAEEEIEQFRIKSLSFLFNSYLSEGAAWLKAHKGVRSLAILYALIDFAEEKKLSDFIMETETLLNSMVKLITRVLYSLDNEVMETVLSYMVSKNTGLTKILTREMSQLIARGGTGIIYEYMPKLYIGNEVKTPPHPFLGPRRCVEPMEPMLYSDERKYEDMVISVGKKLTKPIIVYKRRKGMVDKRQQRSEESASSDEGPEYFPPAFTRQIMKKESSGSLNEIPVAPPTTKKSSSGLDSRGIYRSPCGKQFSTYRGYKQHSRKNFECQNCLSAMKQGHRASYESFCGIDFETPVKLRDHNKGEKRCEECARIYQIQKLASTKKVKKRRKNGEDRKNKRTNGRNGYLNPSTKRGNHSLPPLELKTSYLGQNSLLGKV